MKELPTGSSIPTPKPRALTIEIEFDNRGAIADYSIYCSVLQNPIRLTYEEVECMLAPEKTTSTKPFTLSSIPDKSSAYCDLEDLHDVTKTMDQYKKRVETDSNASVLGFESSFTLSSLDKAAIFKRVTSPEVTQTAIEQSLNSLFSLAKKRRQYRQERGSIDFVFSEPRFHITGDSVEGIIDSPLSSLRVIIGRHNPNQ